MGDRPRQLIPGILGVKNSDGGQGQTLLDKTTLRWQNHCWYKIDAKKSAVATSRAARTAKYLFPLLGKSFGYALLPIPFCLCENMINTQRA